jgi:lysozyme
VSNPIVIDISHHQPDPIDWTRLKANGTVGVIHKATEGVSYVDPKLFSRAKNALEEGLKWSTYHFLRPGKMTQQMDHYLTTIQPVEGERVCIDHEDAGVPLEDLEDAIAYLMELRPDLQVTIYSGHLIKEQLGNRHSATLAKTSLWVAQYTSAESPTWPTATWPAWSLWQFTDQATAAGISGKVDGNRWNGSIEALLAWFGPAGEDLAPPPEPPDVGEWVDIQLKRSSKNVHISITLDGEIIMAGPG